MRVVVVHHPIVLPSDFHGERIATNGRRAAATALHEVERVDSERVAQRGDGGPARHHFDDVRRTGKHAGQEARQHQRADDSTSSVVAVPWLGIVGRETDRNQKQDVGVLECSK